MKFDCIVGNPPYQAAMKKSRKSGSRLSLWDKFTKASIGHINEGGYLAYIHPGVWRKPEAEMWPVLTQYQIEWLEQHPMHSNAGRETGNEVFGVATSFDCYVLHKIPYTKPTLVNDFSGTDSVVDLKKRPWLAGGEFDILDKILVKNGEERCDAIRQSSYHQQRGWMSKEKKGKFKYPCINNIDEDGTITFWWSARNDNGYFGERKVCFTFNGHVYTVADYDGKYGLTEAGIAIRTATKKETDLIVRALNTDTFKRIVWATKWSNFLTEWKMFTYFKKDFYKIILEEESKRTNTDAK